MYKKFRIIKKILKPSREIYWHWKVGQSSGL